MRLLIVGTLHGQLTLATKLAMDKGAAVTHAESAEQALRVLRAGRGADLLMVDVAIDIRRLLEDLEAERIHVPIVACGTGTDARAAVAAIHPAAARSGADRSRARGRRRRFARVDLPRRNDGAGGQAGATDRAFGGLRPDHRRIRHRQGGDRALRSRQVEPGTQAVHLDQLRRYSGEPA